MNLPSFAVVRPPQHPANFGVHSPVRLRLPKSCSRHRAAHLLVCDPCILMFPSVRITMVLCAVGTRRSCSTAGVFAGICSHIWRNAFERLHLLLNLYNFDTHRHPQKAEFNEPTNPCQAVHLHVEEKGSCMHCACICLQVAPSLATELSCPNGSAIEPAKTFIQPESSKPVILRQADMQSLLFSGQSFSIFAPKELRVQNHRELDHRQVWKRLLRLHGGLHRTNLPFTCLNEP